MGYVMVSISDGVYTMSKLKTLKDLEQSIGMFPDHSLDFDQEYEKEIGFDAMPEFAHTKTLRQEAIKWIKDMRINFDENVPSGCRDTIGLICWIKYFFNIPDEDLK